MSKNKTSRLLHQQIAKWRWIAPIAILALAALYQLLFSALKGWIPSDYDDWLIIAVYGLSGGLVAWFALDWLSQKMAQQERTEAELRAAHESLAKTHRQLLAVHDIGQEIASASDMQKVLELATRAPTHLAGAKGSTIITVDREQGRLKLDMAWGLSDKYLNTLRRRMEAGIPSARCLDCQPLAARLGGDCMLFGGMDELAYKEGIQSLICLPLMRDTQCEGFINAYFPSPDGPPEEQVQLLNIVATEIAAALDSVRLRSNQKTTLYVIERLTHTEPDLDDLLGQVLDITLAGWGVQNGAILLYNESEAAWHHWTQRGLADDPTHPHFLLAVQLAEAARQSGQPILIPDLATYTTNSNGLRSGAVAPLFEGRKLLGVLLMTTQQLNFFQPRQAPFFAAIAHQAALAISNAQLHGQVQQMAILEERYRLSREIHDGLAQTLGSLGWHLDYLKTLLDKNDLQTVTNELETGRQMVRDAYLDVREAIDGLRLQSDHSGDFNSALAECVAEFEDRSGVRATVEANTQPVSLPTEMELQLLRIVQEALTNIRKHANASNVWVRLQYLERDNRLSLTIADDGVGFDPALPRGRGHLGLSTMRERAQSQNGELMVVTGPKQGTRLTVTLHLTENQKHPVS